MHIAENEIRTAKRKAEKEGKLTPVQQFSQASKIVESASYGETIYTERQIKWAKDIVAKYTGGAEAGGAGTSAQLRNQAKQTLQSNNYPITEANIQMIMKQLQGNI